MQPNNPFRGAFLVCCIIAAFICLDNGSAGAALIVLALYGVISPLLGESGRE